MNINSSVILISSNSTEIDVNFSKNQKVSYLADAYIDIVVDHGGIPLIVPNKIAIKDISYLVNFCSGLLLTGGGDISPKIYEKESNYTSQDVISVDEKRDQVELALFNAFYSMRKPILGICRGMQLINVALGGTLIQHIENTSIDHCICNDGWVNYHEITITPGSKIMELMKTNTYFSSSSHHQCIDSIGNNLRVAAIASDGVIEMIESLNDDTFLIGIQGHPEKSRKNLKKYEEIFEYFISQTTKEDFLCIQNI